MISILNSYVYSNLFKNPISPSDRNPYTDSIYGAGITAMYSNKINNMADKELAGYVKGFNSNMNNLKASSSKLIEGSKDSQYNYKTAISSSSAVEGLNAAYGTAAREYSLKVDRLATAEINRSAKLESKTYNSFTEGTNSIRITSGSKSAVVSFETRPFHINKDVLQEASNKINASGMNVNSRVISDDTGSSYLELTSKSTGASNRFEIEDLTGDFAAKSGVNTIVQNAENARYFVDGKEYEADSNDIKLDSGKISLRLKSIGEARVKVIENPRAVYDGVKSFTADYNSTLNLLDNQNGSKSAAELRTGMSNIIKSRKNNLQDIGINISDRGNIEIDDRKLSTALKDTPSKVKSILSTPYGIAGRINKLAEDASSKPVLSYMDTDQTGGFSGSGLYNYISTAQKLYLGKSMQQGILFDKLL